VRERERKRAATADGPPTLRRPEGGNGALPRGARGTMNPLRTAPRASERSERTATPRVCAPVCHPRGSLLSKIEGDLPRGLLMDSFSPSRGQLSRNRMILRTKKMQIPFFSPFLVADHEQMKLGR